LGFYYEHGIFVKRSIKTAKTWYERSAYQGFAEAQAAIGNLLMKQIDTTYYETEGLSDEAQLIKEQALDWLNKAKDQVRKQDNIIRYSNTNT
jgi:TPR repeat protein